MPTEQSNPKVLTTTDLVVLLFTDDASVLRDGYSAAEAARLRGSTASVIHLDPRRSDDQLLQSVALLAPRLTLVGVAQTAFARTLGATEALVRGGITPLLLFGGRLALEGERAKVPVEAATGVVVGDPTEPVVEFLRNQDSEVKRPVAGLDLLDGDYRPRAPGVGLDRLPTPQFREADLVVLRRDGLPIRMSRGCPRRCALCSDQPLEGRYRIRPAHEVVEEMIYHARNNDVRRFNFVDLVINGDLEQLEAICDMLLQQEEQLQWWGRALVDANMPRQLYRKMRLAGCIGLEFDVLSGSDRVLESQGAGFTADDATEAVTWANAAGLNVQVSVVIGLPGEAELEFGETAAWLEKNRYHISRIKDLMPCTLQEGSILLRNPAAFDISLPVQDPKLNWHNGGYNTRAYRNKKAREMKVFVEDELHLAVVGKSMDVSWEVPQRQDVQRRVMEQANISMADTGRYKNENLHIAGAMKGKEALGGPINLEIDLTNNCNQHCAGCWVHSFMMKEERLSGAKRRATLDYDTVAKLIRSAKAMGTKQIQLSGAGDPFMHPKIMDVIELIKDEGFTLNVITNFTLMNKDRARRLVDLGVDSITVSLWAGTTETYVKTHPTARKDTFDRLVDTVGHLTWYRRQTGANKPRVKIYNVISNLNAHEVNEMISVSREMGADLIEFTPIDVMKGYTDELELSKDDAQQIMDTLMNARHRPDYLQRTAEEVTEGRLPGLDEQGEYARFLQHHRLVGDFRFSLDDIRRWETFCRRGIHCSSVYEEIHRDSAIFFGFPESECHNCMGFVDCSIDPITLTVRAPYLSLQGFGSFWRRVAGEKEGGGRDMQVVDQVPCAIGYTYARVQATGHVIPCCKASDFPLGNILENSFEEVWHSEAYEEFRRKARVTPKSDPYFAPMECYKVCDNLGHNMATHDTICGMHPRCKDVLEE